MAAKNPKLQLASYKNWCARKHDSIVDFIKSHEAGISPDEGDEFESLIEGLKEQFGRLTAKWDEISSGVAEDAVLYEELDKLVSDVGKTVEETVKTAKRFLKKKLVRTASAAVSSTGATAPPIAKAKLPAFWTEECELWFINVEAQFRVMNITTEVSKFNQVVAQLDSTTASFAGEILRAELKEEERPYAKLKARILEVLSLSCNEKADKLLDMNGFGDKTPSQGLQAMLKLVPAAEAGSPGFLFRRIFLRQLTPDVRNNLAQTEHTASTVDSLRQLAKQADRYYHSTGARINAVAASGEPSGDDLGVDAVAGRVLCRLHRKYGTSATRCEKSKGVRCDWVPRPHKKTQGNANGRA